MICAKRRDRRRGVGFPLFRVGLAEHRPARPTRKRGRKYLFLVRLPRAAFRSCEHERSALGWYERGRWPGEAAARPARSDLRLEDLRFERGGDAPYRASGFVGRGTWACARRPHSSPGFHITGFQPSEVGEGTPGTQGSRHSASSPRLGTRALRAPKSFQLGFERPPISAVFGLFGADFGIERFAQPLTLTRNSDSCRQPDCNGRRRQNKWSR